jgi:cell shape-determining protein MreC
MTENQFKFDRDTVATNLTPIVYDEERMSIGEVLDKLNELSDENEQLKQRIKELEQEIEDLRMDNIRLNKCCDSFMKEAGLNDHFWE